MIIISVRFTQKITANMAPRKINKAIKLIEESVLTDLIEQLTNLNVDPEIISQIHVGKQKNTKKRTMPKIPIEKQCTATCKNGEKCVNAICDKNLAVCWAHMDKDQRNNYRELKKK